MEPKKKSSRITIRTVAEDAGVSFSAVSKVLRNAYGVSDTLRAKVQASIERLGYRPHAAARGMKGHTYTLGVILPNMHNPFFSDVMLGVNDGLNRTPYQALLGVSRAASEERSAIDAIVDRQMDGLILIAPRMKTSELVAIAETIPTVVLGLHLPDVTAFDTVNNDDTLGASLVVRHLKHGGYRSIAYFTMDTSVDYGRAPFGHREVGYRAAMNDLGLSERVRVIAASENLREIQLEARKLLEASRRPEAIFCWTDYVAFEVLSVAVELGLRVPEDVAIVGYDNTAFCDLAPISLTSVDQSGQQLGMQAAQLLVERIKGRSHAEHVVITPRIVGRGSSLGAHDAKLSG